MQSVSLGDCVRHRWLLPAALFSLHNASLQGTGFCLLCTERDLQRVLRLSLSLSFHLVCFCGSRKEWKGKGRAQELSGLPESPRSLAPRPVLRRHGPGPGPMPPLTCLPQHGCFPGWSHCAPGGSGVCFRGGPGVCSSRGRHQVGTSYTFSYDHGYKLFFSDHAQRRGTFHG